MRDDGCSLLVALSGRDGGNGHYLLSLTQLTAIGIHKYPDVVMPLFLKLSWLPLLP